MLFTASTIKDSPANARFFVDANLASGVDHMFVFLDSPKAAGQQEIAADLATSSRVTCIPTGRTSWWSGDRPAALNTRQRINANWVRAVLEPFAWAEWLFHIDGDEVACLDRGALDDVPSGIGAVRLQPLEAVSVLEPPARPIRFKRLLDDADLNLLHVLGAVDAPTNQAFFHGHVMGKAGVRPRSGLALTLHDAISADGRPQERHEDPRLRLLHYDAISGDEFVRKWNALARAGHARYRPSRAPTARALKTLISRDLPEAVREKYLRRIYELTTQDDVDLLDELGLLVDVDPEHGGQAPRPLPPGAAQELAARVEAMRAGPKRRFFVGDETKDGPGDARASTGDEQEGKGRQALRRLVGRR